MQPGPCHSYRGNSHLHSILTDHNYLVDQKEEGWRQGVLTLVDIEVNDLGLQPQHNKACPTPHASRNI